VPGRLESKPVLDHLLPVAAAWAAAYGLPLQLHTGFGDRDLDLRLANPLHLRPLLEGGALARGPVVLLHAGYPYVRAAAYLASVYPNVYVDVSLAAPLLAGPGLVRVLEDLLALAPVTKVLYGSDAWGIPEWFWLAARATRRALAEALAWLPESEARWAARRILRDNAAALYRLAA
jgi:predicted TIM-barrel fold metal-dependent hydrolase